MNQLIRVESISKNYWNEKKVSFLHSYMICTEAVKNVSFQIAEGEIVGLTGPNGAGKSTILNMLSGLLLPDTGSIQVGDLNPVKNRKQYVKQIGVLLAGQSQLPWGMSVIEALEWNSRFYGMTRKVFVERLSYFMDLLELESAVNKDRSELSLGERMKLELTAVFLHHPKILFLDEPTIGIDVTAKETIRNFLKQMNKTQNLTMILTSHDTGDIHSLCERNLVLENGELTKEGTGSNMAGGSEGYDI